MNRHIFAAGILTLASLAATIGCDNRGKVIMPTRKTSLEGKRPMPRGAGGGEAPKGEAPGGKDEKDAKPATEGGAKKESAPASPPAPPAKTPAKG